MSRFILNNDEQPATGDAAPAEGEETTPPEATPANN